ncbi:MAG TPA: MoxR family ATPase [Actinocrinis sp.]|nr:MoxR family ATPase [Actinocrinis sp.]
MSTGPVETRPEDGERPSWWIYRGDGLPPAPGTVVALPDPPPWRTFRATVVQPPSAAPDEDSERKLGRPNPAWPRRAGRRECDMVNAAIRLRRPLLVTGPPGAGKSALAYRVARELGLGRVLKWPVTSHTTLRSGLYEYDAIGRAQAAATVRAVHAAAAPADNGDGAAEPGVGDFVRLGPVGTALLPYERPRVLLIDELDKSDIDLPNDLLHIFEDGEFTIPELVRVRQHASEVPVYTDDPGLVAVIRDGRLRCRAFPIVVITSNGEREFPPAFLRRCLPLEIPPPDAGDLASMIRAQLPRLHEDPRGLIQDFMTRAERNPLARDQLLNALYLIMSGAYGEDLEAQQGLIDSVLHSLSAE